MVYKMMTGKIRINREDLFTLNEGNLGDTPSTSAKTNVLHSFRDANRFPSEL